MSALTERRRLETLLVGENRRFAKASSTSSASAGMIGPTWEAAPFLETLKVVARHFGPWVDDVEEE